MYKLNVETIENLRARWIDFGYGVDTTVGEAYELLRN